MPESSPETQLRLSLEKIQTTPESFEPIHPREWPDRETDPREKNKEEALAEKRREAAFVFRLTGVRASSKGTGASYATNPDITTKKPSENHEFDTNNEA